jgi:glutamate N-acetyltransferase/amino-acid N-acetyltransferase
MAVTPLPLGFRFAAVSAGIRKDGRTDLGLACADAPCVATGVFTRNLVRAAPVELASARLRSGSARAILVNSGCANACTGKPGLEAARVSTRAVADALGCAEDEVLPASTGVIGALLPAEKIVARAGELAGALSADGWDAFSRSILTTDRFPKVARRSAGGASVLAIAKGAGMIHPDLGPPHATMLAFLFTDAVVERAALARMTAEAADRSFNAVSVDGDTSTNDCLLVLASGASRVKVVESELLRAMTGACDELARAMVADGEGAEHSAEIRVLGLASDQEARQIAKTVATSLLVKTALFGCDANWGRLLAAAGRAGVRFDPARARITVGEVEIVREGVAVGAEAERRAAERLAQKSSIITLELGDGPGRAHYVTCDLGHGYVDVNAGYRS